MDRKKVYVRLRRLEVEQPPLAKKMKTSDGAITILLYPGTIYDHKVLEKTYRLGKSAISYTLAPEEREQIKKNYIKSNLVITSQIKLTELELIA